MTAATHALQVHPKVRSDIMSIIMLTCAHQHLHTGTSLLARASNGLGKRIGFGSDRIHTVLTDSPLGKHNPEHVFLVA